jgi:glycosyltransferase involved in cell wall biosynthesis
MLAFQNQGHRVISLSQQEGYLINDFFSTKGIETHSYTPKGYRSGWWYSFKHLIYFIQFCWKHRIDVVYSHLEPANFVASMGQYFVRAKTYICRHHIDEGMLYNFDKDLSYRITYLLARKIIVVSNHARNYMIDCEGIAPTKILHINLAYDFNLYNWPDEKKVQAIRRHFKAAILLLSACRLTAFKRPDIAIHTLKRLIEQGLDVRLILLGQGEMGEHLKRLIADLGLQDQVFMPGYVNNVIDYMAAADFFIHPSLLDSSCVTVKEAGLAELPVVVCRGIGDFDDFLINSQNGFLVDKEKFVEETAEIISSTYKNKERLRAIGSNLKKSVLERFSVKNVIDDYNTLNSVR